MKNYFPSTYNQREQLLSQLFLLICAIPLFYLCISDRHPLGDDFAQYIKEAMNIAHGQPFYQSGYIYNPHNIYYAPPQYPPGFPLLLAPVVRIYGIAFRPMLYLEAFFCLLLLFTSYQYYKRQMRNVAAICMALLLTYSWNVIDIKRSVLADIPCLLFTISYLWVRNMGQIKKWRIVWLALLATAAALMRSQGLLLLVAEAGWFIIAVMRGFLAREGSKTIRDQIGSIAVIGLGAAFYLLTTKVIFYSPVETNSFYGHFLKMTINKGIWHTIKDNLHFLREFISVCFHYDTQSPFFGQADKICRFAGLILCLLGFAIKLVKGPAMQDVFFILMCALILLMPVEDPRYFMPAIPLVFFYAFTAVRAISTPVLKQHGYLMAVIVLLFFMIRGAGFFRDSVERPCEGCTPNAQDVVGMDSIRKKVNDTDIIACAKPRLLTLFTGKRAMNMSWEMSPAENKKVLDSLNVRYLLIVRGIDDGFIKDCLQASPAIDSAIYGDNYTLYTIR